MNDQERLLRHVAPCPFTGCWLWTGFISRYGYGLAKLGGKNMQAHRATYTLWRGPIKPGLVLDHLCRTRACVNPTHLRRYAVARYARLNGKVKA